MNHISLSQLNSLVAEAISLSLNDSYWVVAEVSELRTAANGHCYMELVEKDAEGKGLLAKASAHVWKNTWLLLRFHFEEQTGHILAAGMKILVEVEPVFHELYGYSLNILDIDPTYTQGDMARQRAEILNKLEEEGVLTLNKQLLLPHPILHIAVISSSTAAGYGDFMRQLEASSYQFKAKLFPAIMQGDGVEGSIINALEFILSEHINTPFDCVCILRGGGAVSDLQGFESYLLAASVAQFPLPILTGIGHERDETVIDLVAHTRLKTPTAVAAFLIEQAHAEAKHLYTLESSISNKISTHIKSKHTLFDVTANRLSRCALKTGSIGRENIIMLRARIEMAVHRRITEESMRLDRLEKSIEMADPDRILALGYSITTINGNIVRSVTDVKENDILETHISDGIIRSSAMK